MERTVSLKRVFVTSLCIAIIFTVLALIRRENNRAYGKDSNGEVIKNAPAAPASATTYSI